MQFCKECGGALNLFETNDKEVCWSCVRKREEKKTAAPPAQSQPTENGELNGATFYQENDMLVLKAQEGWVLWSGPLSQPTSLETILKRRARSTGSAANGSRRIPRAGKTQDNTTMTITISVGSGKGGTGKSMAIANLALLLARQDRRVCVVDLDLGGPDIHILYGLFEPQRTLTDYLTRKIEQISEAIHTIPYAGVQIIPGTGNTLHTANISFQEKQRLFRSLATIDTDVLLIDVGAGTSYHTLDFFMHSDIQLCVTSPEPTAIMDFYTFLQLATIRKALGSFLSQSDVGTALKENSFESLHQLFEAAETIRPGAREIAQQALHTFNPLLIVNKVGTGARLNLLKLRKLAQKYLGIYLPDLGEIPYDEQVDASLRAFLPVTEYAPDSPASLALADCSTKLGKVIDLYLRKRSEGGAHDH